MNRRLLMTLLLACLAGKELNVGETAHIRVGQTDENVFALKSTDEWKVEIGEIQLMEFGDAIIRPRDGKEVLIDLRFLNDTPDRAAYDTPEELRAGAELMGKPHLEVSVERKMNFTDLNPAGRYCCIAHLTDSSLKDAKQLPDGQFRAVAVGMVRVTNDAAMAFSIYYNDRDSEAFRKAFAYTLSFVRPGDASPTTRKSD